MRERSIAWIVKRPFVYDLLRLPLRLYYSRDDNPAFRIWVSFLLHTYRGAFGRARPVIWSSAFVPSELVYGLGGVPVHPEILASLMAYFNISGRFLEKGDSRISTDLCSFYRIALGMAMADLLPRPDVLISSSNLCDGSNKFFGYLGRLYGVPHFFLDVPYHDGCQGRRYLLDQLQGLIESVQGITGIPWTRERIQTIVRLSNQARVYLLRVNQLRRSRPAPFPASEALSYGAGMIFSSFGTAQGVAFHRALYRFVRQRVDRGRGYLPEERHRLLWLHHIRPYYPNDIFEVLSRKGAAVAFEEVSHVYWPPLREEAILEGLCDKMASSFSNGPLERRVEKALEM
ncbi:MAG: 2-hydroxyacyl-CoA dehydratase, partial [Deltaproteobacteria bacterium]|nr:2-hydroxyacyl-CoA dehydratase [Deltaproteobacteria bacterium]